MNNRRYIWLFLAALILCSCEREEPSRRVTLPVSVCLPSTDMASLRRSPASASSIGDPGQREQFLFPHHLYIVVVKQNKDASWSVWNTIERSLTDGDWEAERYTGLLPNTGDSIYRYTEQINLLLSADDTFPGRVYAIASAEPLVFNRTFSTPDLANLDNTLNLTFDASSETIQKNLQHIYSTPYNLEQYGKYFGTFSGKQRVPHLNLLLYHIAAKVDISWSVAEDKRINKDDPSQAVRLTKMEAQNLYSGPAYCFKPMDNSSASKLSSGSSRVLVSPGDEGLWWEGRSYFYTIPYTTSAKPGYFPLQMVLETNESGNENKNTLNLKIDSSSPFVPWLRANFNIKSPLPPADGSAEKDVENDV